MSPPILTRAGKAKVIIPAIVILLAAGSFGAWSLYRTSRVNWARDEGLPEIVDLIVRGDHLAAFRVAERVEKQLPDDPLLAALWPRMAVQYTITTDPPGAEIFFKEYSNVDDDWQYLGQSPILDTRFPIGAYRYKVEHDGFDVIQQVHPTPEAASEWFSPDSVHFVLPEAGSVPTGMVAVMPDTIRVGLANLFHTEAVALPLYFIDKYEVTNARFREFVEAGGYSNRAYWKEEFVRDGKSLPWDEVVAEFTDATGQSGPATWRDGSYLAGEENHPVGGVSWYEAAAYAEFADRSLPTLHHWSQAIGISAWRLSDVIVPLANLSAAGPAPVGVYQGIGTRELYDYLGNVREWCWNATGDSGDRRYSVGGAWSDSSYGFMIPRMLSPWDRSPENGIRTIHYPFGVATVPDGALNHIAPSSAPGPSIAPISDDASQELVARVFSYDPLELNAVIDSVDDSSPLWRRELISFDAAHGEKRMKAVLFLPKRAEPPYQTIVYGPSGLAASSSVRSWDIGRVQGMHDYFWEFLALSGRAVMYPVYWGTFERRPIGGFPADADSAALRDRYVERVLDFKRSVEYLASRSDIDMERLGYYGVSWGANYGLSFLATDDRIKAGVTLLRGYPYRPRYPYPEVDQRNFAPRVYTPVLFIDGESDLFYEELAGLTPLIDLLGTPSEHIRRLLLPGGHGVYGLFGHKARIHITEWFDRYFGRPAEGSREGASELLTSARP